MRDTENAPAVAERYPKEKYNTLMPSETVVESVSALHRATAEIVSISANPRDGDVYPLSSFGGPENLFGLAKPAVMKIAHAAGIFFVPQGTGRADDGSNPDRVEYVATAGIVKPDGRPRFTVCSYELDLANEENILRRSTEKKADEKNWNENRKRKWVDDKVQDMMLKYRRHKVAKCDTGAHLRCVKELVGLKSGYTKDELTKPFVVHRVDFVPDLSDPNVLRVMLETAADATNSLFAGPRAIPAPGARGPHLATRQSTAIEDAHVEEETQEDDEQKKEMEAEMRRLVKEEVITRKERDRIESGLARGMSESVLKKGVTWLKEQVEERKSVLEKEKQEDEAKQLSMPWEGEE